MEVSAHVRHSMNLWLFFLSALSRDLRDMLGCQNIQRILCITFFWVRLCIKNVEI